MKRHFCVLFSCLTICSLANGQSGIITTVAGGAQFTFPDDVTAALNAPLGHVTGVAVDALGNVYVADQDNNRVFLISPSGGIRTLAGNGSPGFFGDGGPAASASLYQPTGVAVDASGNVFIADSGNNRIRRVSASGIITTAAGNGSKSFSGDGGPANSAALNNPFSVAVDGSGNILIGDSNNNRIREVSSSGIITTVAGNGSGSFSGDGGPATSAALSNPMGVAVDASGNLFIADFFNDRIRKVSSSGNITTVAGDNQPCSFPTDGLQATSQPLCEPEGVAVDANGNLFIADTFTWKILKVSTNGILTTVAGSLAYGLSGDGGPATSAVLNYPAGVAVDVSGNVFIADTTNERIRKVSAGGIISTIAGNENFGFSGDGGPATSASLNYPYGVALDGFGNLFIADENNNRIRKVSPSGVITTVAGNGNSGFSGDGGPGASTWLFTPTGIAVDAAGNLFIADRNNHRIRKLSTSGMVTTVAGNGVQNTYGDGGPATVAALYNPSYVAVDTAGNLYIVDGSPGIRKVSASGIITTVAGGGKSGLGDGGPATSASLNGPGGVVVDSSGNLFITDAGNYRIRKVSASGIITTVAGNGTRGSSGDGGPATSASLNDPQAIVVDPAGNLFFADGYRIRKVSADGVITTVAGNGSPYFSGDGGPATSASFSPGGIALDASGNLFIADSVAYRIREVSSIGYSGPSLTVSPLNLTFSLAAGGSSSRQITVTAAAGSAAWSASTSASWITLTPAAGTGVGTISVAVNAATLTPGTYTASITISNPSASPAQEIVNVGLTVTAATATLSVTPASLDLQDPLGTAVSPITIQIAGTAGITWQATATTSTGGAWLSVSPVSGVIPASLTALVNASGLAVGTFQGSITVQAPGVTSSTIGVTLTVTAANGQGGIISTVAGSASGFNNGGFSGDGGPATSSLLNWPAGLAVDSSGDLFIADFNNNRIRKVAASGIITTVAGSGATGHANGKFSGDGGPATSATLAGPVGIAVDSSGNLFIADTYNSRIRKVSATGIITTVAGNGNLSFSGDGGPATAASLFYPEGVAVDGSGNLFIADNYNQRIRKVSTNGIITTVAGNGTQGFSGDGGPATSATFYFPTDIRVDAAGNLFILDEFNDRVRKVSTGGIITTVAGNGSNVFCGTTSCTGDGGPAASAALNGAQAIALDGSGNLYIADSGNSRIRKVSTSGIIATVAGSGNAGFAGDGGPATSAFLLSPDGVAVDGSGNLFISDNGNERVRKVSASAPLSTAPSIAPGGIVPVGSTVATIQPGEWVSVYGANLASSTVTWNGDFPISLGGTSVTINGKSAYLSLVSPGQINLQAPTDTATGSVPVVVTTAGGSATATVTMAQFAPSFFLLDAKHVAGIILRSNGSGAYGGGSYDIIGPTGNSLGYATVAAKAGDSIELFAGGLGPTNPTVSAGQAYSGAAPATNPVKLLMNNVSVTPAFAGLSGAGLYQINVTVPAGLGTGDVSLVATVGSAQTPPGAVISLQAAAVTPQVQSLTLSPNSVAGGGTVTGTVVLSPAAPSGGTVVALSSSSSAASVPATVTIPAGATSAAFTVSAGTVTSSQTVTITASYAGSSAQASLTVTPPTAGTGQLSVSGNPFGFSAGLYVGAQPATLTTYTVTDSGSGSLSYTVTADVPWLSFSPSSGTLAPNASTDITMSSNAATSSLAAGTYSAAIAFSSGTTSITRGATLAIVNPPPAGCSYASAGPYQFRVVNQLSTDAMVYFGNVVLPGGQTGSLSFGLQMQPNECDIVGLPEIAVYDVDVSRYPNGTVVSNSLTFTGTTSGFLFNGRSAYTVLVTSGTCSAASDKGKTYLGQSVYSVCAP